MNFIEPALNPTQGVDLTNEEEVRAAIKTEIRAARKYSNELTLELGLAMKKLDETDFVEAYALVYERFNAARKLACGYGGMKLISFEERVEACDEINRELYGASKYIQGMQHARLMMLPC